MTKNYEIEYYETTIQNIISYFVSGFNNVGKEIKSCDPFIDYSTGKVILKLCIQKEE